MRRYKKKELLETVDMLVEANGIIDRLCKSNTERALEILGQCQESAILLGNLIESKGEGYAELVEILENYCENIYQMSTALNDENQIRKISKKIQKQLVYLNNRIQDKIPEDKKEVVFFPYKASMWDSLESVWMAADADAETDAYVVPIPYYDKNPDGSFREMHYEGNEYPDYVPVVHYEEYDFEERRPDVIFIHNPYDNYNYVTSVHPRFYSGNLKKYTDKLVYIPYFILGEIKPDNDEAIKGIKHFCINEAVKNADKVIVQSGDMRQIYIKVLTEESGGSKEAKAYWENKIDGSGSPKVDKVLRTKKEDVEIPEDWMKVIRKPDGSFKKIIFYNTSVTALLEHDEQMLKKIESVFQLFRERKDEVVLLWRPHPLMENTLISMRPELWERYQKIRDQYREEGWGIYDDTADMNRAVVLSDAYYGDWSSIVWLYQKTGKPVMIQDANITDELFETDSLLVKELIADAVVHRGKIWFITHNFNSLFSMDTTTGEVMLAGTFPDEEYSQKRLYEVMKVIGNRIYCIPFYAKNIAVYDIENKKFDSITLDEKQIDNNGKPIFGGTEVYGKYLFITPVFSKVILRLNTDTGEIDYITDWLEQVENLVFNKEDAYFRRQSVFKGNRLLIPFCNANAILELDCETMKCVVYQLGTEENGYSGICYDNRIFWLAPRKPGYLVQWNPEANYIEKMKIDQDETRQISGMYVGILCHKKGITLFSSYGEENEAERVNTQVTVQRGSYIFAKEENAAYLYYQSKSGRMTIIEKKNNYKIEVDIKVKHIDINKQLLLMRNYDVICERESLNIKNLIAVLIS